MYRAILLILYMIILIPSLTHLIRYRDVPSSRRISVGLSITGLILAPYLASFLCELLVSMFSIGIFLIIFLGGLAMMLRSLFGWRR